MNHQELAATVRNVLAHSYDEDALAALDSLEEQLEALRRHDEAATQDAVTFRKRMVDLEEAIRHELGVTHGDETIRRLRDALDAPHPASEPDESWRSGLWRNRQ